MNGCLDVIWTAKPWFVTRAESWKPAAEPEKCDESESERFSADWDSLFFHPLGFCLRVLFQRVPPRLCHVWHPNPQWISEDPACWIARTKSQTFWILVLAFYHDVLWLKLLSHSKRIYESPATHLPLQIRGSQVEMKACEEAMLSHHKSIRIHKVTQRPNKNIEKGRWHHGTI